MYQIGLYAHAVHTMILPGVALACNLVWIIWGANILLDYGCPRTSSNILTVAMVVFCVIDVYIALQQTSIAPLSRDAAQTVIHDGGESLVQQAR